MRFLWVIVALILLAAAGFAGYQLRAGNGTGVATPSPSPVVTADILQQEAHTTVGNFYNALITSQTSGQPLTVTQIARSNPVLTQSYAQQLIGSSGGNTASTFFCAQSLPTQVRVNSVNVSGGQATAAVQAGAGQTITVNLSRADQLWQISGVTCSSASPPSSLSPSPSPSSAG